MAFSEFEIAKIKKEMDEYISKHRPPPRVRNEVDLSYRLENQSIEIFELRPRWDDPKETIESPIVKFTYVKTQKIWRIYWQRSDLKWYGYEPEPEKRKLTDALSVIEKDQYGCFWG